MRKLSEINAELAKKQNEQTEQPEGDSVNEKNENSQTMRIPKFIKEPVI